MMIERVLDALSNLILSVQKNRKVRCGYLITIQTDLVTSNKAQLNLFTQRNIMWDVGAEILND